MKIIKNEPFEVCKERSYLNCIYQGIALGADNAGRVWKNLWQLFLASLILNFPFGMLLPSAIAALMPKWSEMGFIPVTSIRQQWPDLWKIFCRLLPYYGITILVSVIIYASSFVSVFTSSVVVMSCVLIAWLVLLAATLPLQWVRMELMYGNKSVKACFSAYTLGLRECLRLFFFYVVTGAVCFFVLALAALPLIIQMLVIGQMSEAQAVGDIANVPWFFWPLLFVSAIILNLVAFYLQIILSHAEYLLWGSITASDGSRRSIEEIPA